MGPGRGFGYSLCGIMGIMVDGVPVVGGLSGKQGQWVYTVAMSWRKHSMRHRGELN